MAPMSDASTTPAQTQDDVQTLSRQVEAVLLTVDRPIQPGKIAEALELDSTKPIKPAIDTLNAFFEEHDRSCRVEQVAGGFQLMTQPQYKPILGRLHRTREQSKLSPAAMETLAIIAYRQPILRADIEAIRGVSCGEVVRSLMDKNLVKIAGRADEIGRPMLYGTTRFFLEVFGLSSLKDLPKTEELAQP